MNEPARLHIEPAGASTLRLQGEIDLHTSDDLRRHLDSLGSGADVVLDMAGVQFIDSSGLRVIIRAHQSHQSSGTELRLAQPSDVVTKLLGITGLIDQLNIDGPDTR